MQIITDLSILLVTTRRMNVPTKTARYDVAEFLEAP